MPMMPSIFHKISSVSKLIWKLGTVLLKFLQNGERVAWDAERLMKYPLTETRTFLWISRTWFNDSNSIHRFNNQIYFGTKWSSYHPMPSIPLVGPAYAELQTTRRPAHHRFRTTTRKSSCSMKFLESLVRRGGGVGGGWVVSFHQRLHGESLKRKKNQRYQKYQQVLFDRRSL